MSAPVLLGFDNPLVTEFGATGHLGDDVFRGCVEEVEARLVGADEHRAQNGLRDPRRSSLPRRRAHDLANRPSPRRRRTPRPDMWSPARRYGVPGPTEMEESLHFC